jgi:hypothetical protein
MRSRGAALVAVCAIVLTGLLIEPAAHAATTKFRSCDAMLRVYAHGIAKDKKAADRAVANGQYRPVVAPKVYRDSYKSLDRDKDGSMCEQDVS